MKGWHAAWAFIIVAPLIGGLILAALGEWRALPFFLVMTVCNAVLMLDADRYRAAVIAMLALAAFLLGIGVALVTLGLAR